MRINLLPLVILLSAILLSVPGNALAEPDDFGGYAVSSTIIKLQGKPGQTVTVSFRIFNDTDNSVKASVEVRDFEINGKQIIYKKDVPANWSVAKWSDFNQKEMVLNSKSSIDANFEVHIPSVAEQGEHRALIAVRFLPTGATGNVKVATEILPVLYVTVTDSAGQVQLQKDWTLNNFRVDRMNGGAFHFQIKNNGNVHLESGGSIKLKNLLNSQEQEITIPTVNLLPGAEKDITAEWKPQNWFGIYQTNVRLTMDNDRYETIQVLLFAIPWVAVTIGLVLIASIVAGVIIYLRRLKKVLYTRAKEQAIRELGASSVKSE